MTVGAFFDDLLDRSVVLGYSRLGLAVRQQLWRTPSCRPAPSPAAPCWSPARTPGIGKAIATELAMLGATVLMTVRDRARGEAARHHVLTVAPAADVAVEVCDVSHLAAVRLFAADLLSRHARLDAVIHNAGVMPEERTESAEGHELSLATHVLGPVLLTELLRPGLTTAARVVLMSSGGMYTQALPVDDIEYRRGHYRGATAYARSKRVQVALTPLLARRWPELVVAAMHPGWADTPGVAQSLPGFRRVTRPILRTPEQAADTAVWLTATDPPPESGRFWHDRRIRPTHYLPTAHDDDAQVRQVWQYCAAAVGL